MARKTKPITIEAEGRDKGKTFLLTEMPSSQGQKWAMRALFAIANSGAEVPAEAQAEGMAGLVRFGFRALIGVEFANAEPLADELFGCVQIMTESGVARFPEEEDVEEVETRIFLHAEVFSLHTGFSFADALSRTISIASALAIQDWLSTQTSTEQLAPVSPQA